MTVKWQITSVEECEQEPMPSSTSRIEAFLDEADPYEFEQFVANVWEELGYSTKMTPGSQDRGIDVIAEQETPVRQKMLIQAKAYDTKNRIGSDEVRKYATLYQQEDDVDRVVIVTSSTFTSQAKELASDLNVDVIDREDLIGLVIDAGITPQIGVSESLDNEDFGGQARTIEAGEDTVEYDPERDSFWLKFAEIYEKKVEAAPEGHLDNSVSKTPIILSVVFAGSLLVVGQLFDRGIISNVGLTLYIFVSFILFIVVLGYFANRE